MNIARSALQLGFAAITLFVSAQNSSATTYSQNNYVFDLGNTSTQDGRSGGAYVYFNTVGGDQININYLFSDMKLTYDPYADTLNIGGWMYGHYSAANSTIATASQELIDSMEGWVYVDMTYRDNVDAEFDQFGQLLAVNVGPQSAWNKGTFSYYDNNLVAYLFDEVMPNLGLSLNVTNGGLGQGYFYGSAALVDSQDVPYTLFANHISGDWYFCTGGDCDCSTPIPEPASMILLSSGLVAGAYRRRKLNA